MGRNQGPYKTAHTANRLGVLTRSMIKKAGDAFPHLSARGCQIRDFLPIMIKTLKTHMDVGNAAHRDMFFGLTVSWAIEETLIRCKRMFSLPAEEAEKLNKNCILVCKCITSLTKGASEFKHMFNFTIKTHSLLHFGECAKYINPQLGSCYDGEMLMVVVRKLVQGVGRGSKPVVISNNALLRFVHGLGHELRHPEWKWRS